MDWVAIQKALQNWVVYCTGLAADHVVWGGQQAPRMTQPGIVMKLMMLDDDGLPWVDVANNYITFADITITGVSGDTFTAVAHGRLTGDGAVRLTGADLPLGVEEDTDYWVIKTGADTFKLAASYVDAVATVPVPVTLSDAGSGAMLLVDTATTTRTGEEIDLIQRSLLKMTLTLECYTSSGVGIDMAQAILWRLAAKRLLPTALEIVQDANIGVIHVGRILNIGGTQDLVLFEPRALMDVLLHLTSEETENTSSIERTEITDEDRLNTFTADGAE